MRDQWEKCMSIMQQETLRAKVTCGPVVDAGSLHDSTVACDSHLMILLSRWPPDWAAHAYK